MINEVIVIDDVISKSYQDLIEQTIVVNGDFPWYFCPNVSGDNSSLKHPAWSHKFFDFEIASSNVAITNLLSPLMHEACSNINFYPTQLLNGRVFSLMPSHHTTHNIWHVDLARPHLVCIYYVNDSTGPTIISADSAEIYQKQYINADVNLSIKKVIEPKKGRAVLFDGKFYHASTNPTDDRRVVINFNIV